MINTLNLVPFGCVPIINYQNRSLKKLKNIFHRLDKGSFGFRYPFEQNGTTPSFEKQETIEMKKIILLYDTAIKLLTYTTDVVAEYLPPSNP